MLITIYIIEGESSFEGYGFDLLESGEERGEFSIYIKKLPDATILKVWSLFYFWGNKFKINMLKTSHIQKNIEKMYGCGPGI